MNLNKIIITEIKKTKEEIFSEIETYTYNTYFSIFDQNELKNIVDFLISVMIRTGSGTGEGISKKSLRNIFFKTPEIFRKKFEQIPTNKLWRGDALHPCESEKYYEYDYYLQSYSNKNMASFFGDILINSKSIKDYGGSFSTTLFNKFVSKKDELYLNAFIFYINYPQYSKLFDFNLFYKLYIIISGYGALGKKYKNAVVKIFRNMNLEFYYHKSHIDEIIIADDENEIMFFDVIYKCNNI